MGWFRTDEVSPKGGNKSGPVSGRNLDPKNPEEVARVVQESGCSDIQSALKLFKDYGVNPNNPYFKSAMQTALREMKDAQPYGGVAAGKKNGPCPHQSDNYAESSPSTPSATPSTPSPSAPPHREPTDWGKMGNELFGWKNK